MKPLWYFHCKIEDNFSTWPNPSVVNPEIQIDTKYKTENASILDASFVLLSRGWIPEKEGNNQLNNLKFYKKISNQLNYEISDRINNFYPDLNNPSCP